MNGAGKVGLMRTNFLKNKRERSPRYARNDTINNLAVAGCERH